MKYIALIYGALYTPPMVYYSFCVPYLNEPYVVSALTMFALQLIALVSHVVALRSTPVNIARHAVR